jgi:hypothetical protein
LQLFTDLKDKTVLAVDLNTKHPAWNSQILNRLGMRLLNLQNNSDFQTSAPRYPTHCTPSGNGDVLDIVLHRNVRIFEVNVIEILESDHLPIPFHMLYHFSTRDISAPVEIHTDWERFKSLASDLISPRIQIHTCKEAEETARNVAASIASAYRLSTYKITIPDLTEELPEIHRLLQLKHRLRKLWHETRDPTCKTAVKLVTNTIRRMTRKKAMERWDRRVGNCEVTPRDIWPIARALLNRDAPKAPTAIHGYSGLKFRPYEKANAIVDCLESRFTHHDLVANAMKGGWKIWSKIY